LSIAKNTETEAAQAPTPPCLHFQRDLDLNLAPNQESIDYLISKYVSDIQNVYPILDETLPCLSPGWSVEHNEADLTPIIKNWPIHATGKHALSSTKPRQTSA
jgi:hypothetical protein